MQSFPLYDLQGTSPRERGLQHGNILQELIRKSLNFYLSLFKRVKGLEKEEQLIALAREFERTITTTVPDLAVEINSIAEGGEISPFF